MEILAVIFVKYRDTFLILKRSEKALYHKGLWDTIKLNTKDTPDLRQEIVDSVTSSLNIEPDQVKDVIRWGAYTYENTEKMYYVVKITTPFIDPSWEFESYEWIQFRNIGTFETVPYLKDDLTHVRNL